MARAPRNHAIPDRDGVSPSCIATVPGPWGTMLNFLADRLPALSHAQWAARMRAGWVWGDTAQPLNPDTPFRAHTRLYYWRHTPDEPAWPWPVHIVYHDAHLVVADKPPFMPVTPSGPFVQRSLLVQLKRTLGLPELSPVHRIDRDTAGLVAFAVHARARDAYQQLFRNRHVHKRYLAVAPDCDLEALARQPCFQGQGIWSRVSLSGLRPDSAPEPAWCYRSRLVQDEAFFTMHEEAGTANCETHMRLLDRQAGWGLYLLSPHTGRRHQLRAHLSALRLPIRHDPYYPRVTRGPEDEDDWQRPLQLLAATLAFEDPHSGHAHCFSSTQTLDWPPSASTPARSAQAGRGLVALNPVP